MTIQRLDQTIPYDGDPDPTLPWADATDGLLCPGSLLLFEPNHSANPLSGSPAPGAGVYPNIASSYAIAMAGSCSFTGSVTATTLTVTAIASGSLKPGQTIVGSGLSSATGILAQLTSTESGGALGGRGTYQITLTGTASSEAMSINNTTAKFAMDRGSNSSGATADTASLLKTERSTKGGLHVIISQTNNDTSFQGLSVNLGNALQNWIMGNPNHQYYFSVWDVLTRAAHAAQPPEASFASGAAAGLMALYADGTVQLPSGANRLGAQQSPASYPTLGPRFKAVGMDGPIGGTLPTATYDYNLAQFGPLGAWSNAGSYGNKSSSRVLYRIYLEDLTVSGRSFDEVALRDYSLWQEAMGQGGRYYGDTLPTDPATIP
jgi:hypothetical protein